MHRAAIAVLALAVLFPLTSQAQAWSVEQKQVWAEAERISAAFCAGDMETYYEFVHPDFVFWNNSNSVPGDRKAALELDTHFFGELGGRWHTATFTPLTILVYDDFAVINMYARGFLQVPGGVPAHNTLRMLGVYKKENGRWMLIANYLDGETTP
jgi:ketosteroid isomerase-like protein